ncbi:MAG: hypothetical protein K2Q14_02515 [Gammaproteobacteria bacterium]|nr:hypothetical protein [Gammaproteobacteria bacterium]
MNEKVKAEYFPWLEGRQEVTATPRYKIVARSVALNGTSVDMLHNAGSLYVENYFLKDIVNNTEIKSGMDTKEFELLKWVLDSEINDPVKSIEKDNVR